MPVIVSEGGERPSWSQIFLAISGVVRYRPSIDLLLEEEISIAARECGPDERCIASQLRAGGADLGFIVVINTEVKPAMFAVRLIEAQNATTIAESMTRAEAASLNEAVAKRTEAVLAETPHAVMARLRIQTDPPDSMVKIDGASLGAAVAGAYFVAPGKHRVSASGVDHLDGAVDVSAEAGKDTDVKLVLVERETLLESPWLWLGAGVVAIGTVVAIAFLTRPTDRYMCAPFEGSDCDVN